MLNVVGLLKAGNPDDWEGDWVVEDIRERLAIYQAGPPSLELEETGMDSDQGEAVVFEEVVEVGLEIGVNAEEATEVDFAEDFAGIAEGLEAELGSMGEEEQEDRHRDQEDLIGRLQLDRLDSNSQQQEDLERRHSLFLRDTSLGDMRDLRTITDGDEKMMEDETISGRDIRLYTCQMGKQLTETTRVSTASVCKGNLWFVSFCTPIYQVGIPDVLYQVGV